MTKFEFVGVRGGHGTTTVALAAAYAIVTLNHDVRIAATDRYAMRALAGVGQPVHDEEADSVLGLRVTLSDFETADVIDSGMLKDVGRKSPDTLRYAVLRGPDYLGLMTLLQSDAELDGVVVVAEEGRALTTKDVRGVVDLPVVATVQCTPSIARATDAGLLTRRAPHAPEFRQLRHLIYDNY